MWHQNIYGQYVIAKFSSNSMAISINLFIIFNDFREALFILKSSGLNSQISIDCPCFKRIRLNNKKIEDFRKEN